ncbi:hypothetical protein P7C71_g394, partial [Lecanoromycetidae sp. Uapishka_2]
MAHHGGTLDGITMDQLVGLGWRNLPLAGENDPSRQDSTSIVENLEQDFDDLQTASADLSGREDQIITKVQQQIDQVVTSIKNTNETLTHQLDEMRASIVRLETRERALNLRVTELSGLLDGEAVTHASTKLTTMELSIAELYERTNQYERQVCNADETGQGPSDHTVNLHERAEDLQLGKRKADDSEDNGSLRAPKRVRLNLTPPKKPATVSENADHRMEVPHQIQDGIMAVDDVITTRWSRKQWNEEMRSVKEKLKWIVEISGGNWEQYGMDD